MDMGGGRLIRLMILVLVVVLVWKVWDYSSLPAIDTIPNFKTSDSETKPSIRKDDDQMQNDQALAILPAPNKPEEIEMEVLPTMTVAVYYEALCPDSRHFVMRQLTPAYIKLSNIINLSLVPYGKATTMEKNSEYTFDCQHGQLECQANMVHACVVNAIKDQEKQLSIIHCMIDKNVQPRDMDQPMVVGQKCMEQHHEKWAQVEECVTSSKGPGILKHMGDMTHSLKPKITFIPTTTIDGSQDDQKYILQDLHKVLCRKYKGPKQPSC